ncbi:MAG: hypothetical protein COT91_02295 [Candidatus Doudnabacteria bacterium CG10_big_fil_rev_8_21_14_0_10_41_10]|uniref:LapB rubredoxin metal binding domain-containing protein n=1 Tax=Candidatus Doudnabacteria bacterium CG10_big_fil_rev_8_21_14_0_10_41_10 TaxID=1974551 RepID=A0A2H0VDU6_9BACT|nr:MAG: hypothetical protein COT91_02295 [Candidatus Doudnabacteria bacterium CG10_big_fil_rev_8_21_14_0_10_41_10]
MTRTYDFYVCEVCGFQRARPGMCPYCKLELMNQVDLNELEMVTAGSDRARTNDKASPHDFFNIQQ